jgi:lipopolysaccharide biosynthesis glycosyltransferase
MHDGIPSKEFHDLRKISDRIQIEPVDASSVRKYNIGDKDTPVEVFMRLLLPELVPVNRIIFLDVDLLVRSSLRPLWELDLDGRAVGAVRSFGIPFLGSPKGVERWEELGLDPRLPYFNAGVMLMDLAAWREQALTSEAIRVAGLRQAPLADQGALNIVFAGRWFDIHPAWNQQTVLFHPSHTPATLGPDKFKAARDHPNIVHFVGPRKPWHYGCTHPATAEWRRIAEQVLGAPFNPEPPPIQSRVEQASRRLRAGVKGAIQALRGKF